MTKNAAAYEAAIIESMHTGWAAPDLEYTPITAPLPELVRPAEVAALRQRVVELEAALNDAQLQITRERNNCAWIGARSGEQATRVAELERQLDAIPTGALIDYYYGSEALTYDARRAIDPVGVWVRALEDENARQREAQP